MVKLKKKSANESIELPETVDTEDSNVKSDAPRGVKRLHTRHLFATRKRKIIAISIAAVLVVAGTLLAVPVTRYFLLTNLVKKDVTITVVDPASGRYISDAKVTINGIEAQTNQDGVAVLQKIGVGEFDLTITKQYYEPKTQRYTVPVFSAPQSPSVEMVATGNPVTVGVYDLISGKPVDGVRVTVSDTNATTNESGEAVVVVPPFSGIVTAEFSAEGYDTFITELDTSSGIYTLSITPSGSLYYLSKATGKINVMKSNLDGKNARVVVEGTGQESDYNTSLLSARDWKYSALLASRTEDKERVYLLDSSTDQLSLIDEGNASFQFVGWAGHNFIYIVNRNTTNYWDNNKQAIKSFNADTRELKTLDQTTGGGSNSYYHEYESLGNVYVLGSELVYGVSWYFGMYQYKDPAKTHTVRSINLATNTKKVVKDFNASNTSIDTRLYKPKELYIRNTVAGSDTPYFSEYENGTVKQVTDTNDNKFYAAYPTYLLSPTGNKTLWYEERDGKNVFFIGDSDANNVTQLPELNGYIPYGWYGNSDEYILVSLNASELYILSVDVLLQPDATYRPVKVTNYHKTQTYPGYGSGYGGQ